MKELALAVAACGGGDAGTLDAWGNEPSLVMMDQSVSGVRPRLSGAVAAAAPTTTSSQLAPAKKGRGLQIALVVGLVTVLLGAGAVAMWPTDAPRVVPDPTPIATAPRPAPRPPTPVPATPPKPKLFKMTFNSSPDGAEILRDDEVLGATPATIEMKESEQQVHVVIRKKGYKDHTLDFTPSRDNTFEFELKKDRSHSSSSSSSSSSSGARLPRLSGESDAPADPAPAPKPAAPSKSSGKLRDLKDPFSQ
jgi:hypothetical protein